MGSAKTPASRLAFLDWARGVAAVIMLQGHVFHSFTRNDLRQGSPYVFSQFIGGMPPAIFLFLTGMTLAFLMESRERQGLSRWLRVWAALRRAGYLFSLAFLFRLQLWVFGLPGSPWTDLLRVDILNCMGFAIGLMSVMAVLRNTDRAWLCALAGLAIAGLSPLVSHVPWTQAPGLLKNYLAPDYQFFGFFPWGAFVAFGMGAGSLVRALRKDQTDRAIRWAALIGFGLILGGQYCSNISWFSYAGSEFWLNSPWLILIKLGVVLLLLAVSYAWLRRQSGGGWSWVRQFGTSSLLVYWVHTELVYGRWLYFWKGGLSNGQTFLAAVAVILLMLGLATAKTYRKSVRDFRFALVYPLFVPRRVSGD